MKGSIKSENSLSVMKLIKDEINNLLQNHDSILMNSDSKMQNYLENKFVF